MAIRIPHEYTIDINQGVTRVRINIPFMHGDSQTHRFVFTINDGNDAAVLTGYVATLYAVRLADKVTVPNEGTIDGNVVTIDNVQSDFLTRGRVDLLLTLSAGGEQVTLFWGEGTCSGGITDSIADPSDIVPSLGDLLAAVSDVQAAAAVAAEAAAAITGITAEAETLAPSDPATAETEIDPVDGHINIKLGVPQGPKGESVLILGTYADLTALRAAVTAPSVGDMYNIGASAPYTVYRATGQSIPNDWESQGTIGTAVVDALTSTSPTSALSAAQGKVLNDSKVNKADVIDRLDSTEADRPLSAARGKALRDSIASAITRAASALNAKTALLTLLSRCAFALSAIGSFAPYYIVSGNIASWYDNGRSALLGQKATQGTDGYRPARGVNIPRCTAHVQLPNATGGVSGHGFTITGLTHDAAENMFYAGNIGKGVPADATYASCIVKLSADLATNLGEIDLHITFPALDGIQGLTIDTSDDTIWFCSDSENLVRQITKAGASVGSFSVVSPNGIAYDSRDDTLWVLQTSGYIIHYSKTGTNLHQIAAAYSGQDQLWLDEASNTLYFTVGTSSAGSTYVYAVDLGTDAITVAYTLPESYAVEGIVMVDDLMYIANDGYYHSAIVPQNEVCIYDLSRCVDAPIFDGSDDVLTVAANATLGRYTNLSIAAVFHTHGAGYASGARIIDKTTGSNTGYALNIVNGTDIQWVIYRTDGVKSWTKSGAISLGQTHMVVVTHDTSVASNVPLIYLDGVLLTSYTENGTATGSYTSDTAIDLCVGNRADRARAFEGIVYAITIADVIIPVATIIRMYNICKEYFGLS